MFTVTLTKIKSQPHSSTMKLVNVLAILFSATFPAHSSTTAPHIIFILADDLGVNDVGWRNPRMLTPNLGEILENTK